MDYFYWLTNFLCGEDGCPGSDVETYYSWHTGHVFATSLTVLHKDVDLTGLEPYIDVYPDDTLWPVRAWKCYRSQAPSPARPRMLIKLSLVWQRYFGLLREGHTIVEQLLQGNPLPGPLIHHRSCPLHHGCCAQSTAGQEPNQQLLFSDKQKAENTINQTWERCDECHCYSSDLNHVGHVFANNTNN